MAAVAEVAWGMEPVAPVEMAPGAALAVVDNFINGGGKMHLKNYGRLVGISVTIGLICGLVSGSVGW